MPTSPPCRLLLRKATVAVSLCAFAALSHYAIAQTVAPESDPFLEVDPFATTKTQIKLPTLPVAAGKKSLSSDPSKTPSSTTQSLTPLRILQLGESKAGGPIASIPSDPYMTAEQEARIFAALQAHDDTNWDGVSLFELKKLLKDRLPIWINRHELSIAGIETNDAIENAGDVVAGPLGDRLACLFNETELEFAIRANRLEITSRDDFNSALSIRIYDVTPLVLRIRAGKRVFDFEALGKLIQSTIAHDSWLAAGGSNVISEFIVGEPGFERSLIVVAAPTSVHLQLQPLLDRLNIRKQVRD